MSNLSEFPLDGPVLELGGRESMLSHWNARFPILPTSIRDPYVRRLARATQAHGCVLLHAHFGWMGPTTLTVAKKLGLPLVTTFYGADLAHRKRRWQRQPPFARLFEEGTLFICEGPAMAEHLVGIGCPPEKIRVIPIGIELNDFPYQAPVRGEPLIVVQVARLVEKKGIDLAIEAFAAARRNLGPSELWVVGDGPLRDTLESLARRLGIEAFVRFIGEVTYSECRDLVRSSHIGIQPSRTASNGDTEGGAPTVLIEMQAMGLPVIATRHADIPYVVAAADCLVDEGDVDGLAEALVRLARLSDREWNETSGQGRREVEKRHNVTATASTLEGAYEEARRRFGEGR